MTKECAEYLNATVGRWDKEKSDAAFARIKELERLERMNRKTYVFTVADSENPEKPIVYCELTTDKSVRDQETAEKLINDWAVSSDAIDTDDFADFDDALEDLAYAMRKNGAAWFKERYCFELTEAAG